MWKMDTDSYSDNAGLPKPWLRRGVSSLWLVSMILDSAVQHIKLCMEFPQINHYLLVVPAYVAYGEDSRCMGLPSTKPRCSLRLTKETQPPRAARQPTFDYRRSS